MKQKDKPIPIKDIKQHPDKYIKWMCYNLLITFDNQVFNLYIKPAKEQLVGGSYCYFCNGKYRTKTWIRNNCVDIFGYVTK